MKKRLISLLLTVVMLMSLCTVLSTGASAAANVTTVTLAKGQTVLSLCQSLGVDFYTYKNLIMTLNGFTSESQFSKLAVGQQVVLPASAAAAATLAGSTTAVTASTVSATTTAGTTPATISTATNTTGTLTTGQATSIPSGDRVAYYLVYYTIQSGETIQGIYANWGLSYKTYDNQIKKLNNISSYNSIAAGKTLILPTTNPGVANSSYYTVMAHTMLSGESAYDIICSQYGMNFSANQKMILALNNTTDLSNIWAGSALYIPVSGIVSTSTTVTSGTTSTTTTSATVSTGGVYNLVSQTATNGSFDMQVDGKSVTTAQAGKTVQVIPSADIGYAVDTIKVVKVGDASTVVGVSNGYFTMPSYSVVVSVTFKTAAAYKITVDSASNGSVAALVNGAKVTQGYVGNTVTVKTIPATGFMLDHIRVTYNNYKDSVAVYNNTFVMPDCDVTITATFVKDPDYDPTLGHSIYTNVSNGTITTYVGNTETEYANTGDRVTIDVTPDTNYTLESLVVYYDDFKKTAEVDKSSFTMPDGPVTIVATIKATSAATFAITKVDTANGTFGVYNDGTEVTEAKVGTTLTVKGTPKSGAYWYLVNVTKTGDSGISVPVTYNDADGTSTFTMPDFPVSVQARFYLYHRVILDSSNGSRGYFAVVAGNYKVDKCACGVELSVNIWGVKSGYSATSVILTYADGSSYTLDGAKFIMPDCDVKVKVVFSEQQTIVAHSATVDGKYGQYGNTYTVGGKTMNGNKAATAEVKAGAGSNVVVKTSPAFGYEVDEITIKYTDKSGTEKTAPVGVNPVTEKYQFEMPELKSGTKLNLYVSFKAITTYAITLDYRTGYSSDDDNLDHKKGTFNVTTYTHSAYVDHAKKDQKIQIHAYPASGYAVDTENIQVINVTTDKKVEINKNDYTFIMPESDVVVIVPFVETSHSITLSRSNNGTDGLPKGVLSVIIDGVQYKDEDLLKNSNVRLKFPTGTLVTVVNESQSGYILDSEQPITITGTNGYIKYNTIDGDHFTFEMPNEDVTIAAQYKDEMVAINAVASDHGTYSVPLQVAWNGSFSVTDIVPEQGYELDKILITYVGHDGTKHEKEELNGTKVDLSKEKGMLLSDINVEVTFKAAVNPMTIKYIFDDTPDQNSNYKVDLLVDGKTVEGIDRGYSFDKDVSGSYSGYTDHLYKYDGDDSENGLTRNGIQTGKTVIIKRNESKLDQNFRIVNIWVMSGSGDTAVAIKPDFSNNQYYFTMPYVGSGKSEDLTLCIEYGKYTADAFNLSAYKAGGDGEGAGWQFYVDNIASNNATPSAEEIKFEVTVPDYCEITNPAAVLRYKDSDGVERTQDLELSPDGEGKYSVTFINPVKSMPQGSIVSVEYNVDKKSYELDGVVYDIDADGKPVEDEDPVGTAVYTGDGVTPATEETAAEAKWGTTVTVKVASDDGKAVDNVKIYQVIEEDGSVKYEEISASIVSADTYQFIMPKGEVAVAATFKETSVKTVSLDSDLAKIGVQANILVNNNPSTATAVAVEGDKVTFTLSVPANYTVESGSVSISDGTISGPDASGAYSFTMPAESVVIKASITAKTYDMRVYPLTSKAGVNVPYSVKLSDTVADNISGEYTAEVRYGDKLEIAAVKTDGEITYKIDSCTITYTDINNTPVSLNADITDGVANFTFNGAIPRGNEGDLIEVKPTIVEDKKATYKLILSPTADEYYSLSTNITDIENITIGKSVTIYMDVKYYMDFNPDSVAFSYTADGGQQYSLKDKVTVGKVSGTDLSYRYTFTFSMPASDVNVNIETSGFTEKTQVKTTGTNVYVIDANGNYTAKTQFNLGDQAYVKLDSQKIADGYTCKVRLTYKTENSESITYEQPVIDSGAGYGQFTLSRDDSSSHIPVGATFTVEVSYTQSA